MRVSYDVREQDMAEAVRWYVRDYLGQRKRLVQRALVWLVVAVFISVLVYDLRGDRPTSKTWLILFVFAYGVVLFSYLVDYLFRPRTTLRMLTHGNGRLIYLGTRSTTLEATHLVVGNDQIQMRIALCLVDEIEEFRDFAVIAFGSASLIVISRNAFEGDVDFDTFIKHCRENWTKATNVA